MVCEKRDADMQSQLGVCVWKGPQLCLLIDLFHHYRFLNELSTLHHTPCLSFAIFTLAFLALSHTLFLSPHTHIHNQSADCLHLYLVLWFPLELKHNRLTLLSACLGALHRCLNYWSTYLSPFISCMCLQKGENSLLSVLWESDLASFNVKSVTTPFDVRTFSFLFF